MRIYLVRHGMSEANADWNVNRTKADHAIELTKEGREQAKGAGEFLAQYFHKKYEHLDGYGQTIMRNRPKIRLWHSPYTRTRQTADEIEKACKLTVPPIGDSWFTDRKEHLLLSEQQFGLFDGLSDAEREEKYPDMQAYYEKCRAFEGKLWPKMPLGESRFEVCQRVHQAFGTFHRDAAKHGIEDIVVVGHGTTNRAFVQMWLHKPWEWMNEEKNPRNCSVRLIDGRDIGYIYEGAAHPEGYKHSIQKEADE